MRAGIGLRAQHHQAILGATPAPAWIEAHTENYFHAGGPAVRALERARALYPLSLHGVGLGLGSAEPIDRRHLARVRDAVRRYEPALVSEHACWGHVDGEHFNDLLPLPYTEEAVAHLCRTRRRSAGRPGSPDPDRKPRAPTSASRRRSSAKVSSSPPSSSAVAAGLLLDVNNAYVNASNLGLDLDEFLAALPGPAIQEIHLAGHARRRVGSRDLLIDDHGSAVCDEVWALFDVVLGRFGPLPTLIEWDNDVPPLAILLAEAARADQRLDRCHAAAA